MKHIAEMLIDTGMDDRDALCGVDDLIDTGNAALADEFISIRNITLFGLEESTNVRVRFRWSSFGKRNQFS